MTHLLPGDGLPRVHGARSPVPPRLPHFATPRSLRYLATVVAGAYPLRRPPDAWSPGLPAPPGSCYWLVASGTPMGWRAGCLAAGLVRSTVCYYCLGGCSALVVGARRSRQVWGVGAGTGSRISPWAPPFPRLPRSACCGLCCPGVPSFRLSVRHSMRSVRSAGSVRLPFGSRPRVCWVRVRSCSRGVHASPPPQVGVARALRAVLVQDACRAIPGAPAPPRFLPRSRAPPILLFGGWPGPFVPLPGLGWLAPVQAGLPLRAGFARCGGGTRAPGGRRLLPGRGASGVGRSPTPNRRPWGVRPGPTTHWLWVRGN